MCGYSRLLKRFKQLGALMKQLSRLLAKEKPETLKILDTVPVPLLVGVRAYQSMVVRIAQRYRIRPDWGYCAAKKTYYFGFKMAVLTQGDKILDYTLVPASKSEQSACMALVSRCDLKNLKVFGDKGFHMNAKDKGILSSRNILLEAIPRANMKKVIIPDLKEKKRLRKSIETSFSQLVTLFDLTHFVLRSIAGFASGLIRKVLAYNFSRVLAQTESQNLLAT